MAGFGSFMEGMQGGMKSMSDIQAAWDKRDLTNSVLQEIDAGRQATDWTREKNGLPLLPKRKRVQSIGERLGEWMQSHLGTGDQALEQKAYEPVPPPGVDPPAVVETAIPEEPIELADGGEPFELWDDEKANGPKKGAGKADDTVKRDAARSRAANPAKVSHATETAIPGRNEATNAPKGAKAPPAGPTAIPEGPAPKASLGSRVKSVGSKLGKTVGGALAANAGIGAGAGFNRGYWGGDQDAWASEDTRLSELANKAYEAGGPENLPPEEQQELQSLRTKFEMRQRMGSMEDRGNTGPELSRVPGALVEAGKGAVETLIPDNLPGTAGPAPAPAPAPQEAIPSKPGPSTRGAAPPRDPKFEVPDPAAIDWSKMKGVDPPAYDTRDWVAFRQDAKEEYLMHNRGATTADAELYADRNVTAMQQEGFMSYLKQTAVLLRTDPEAAAKTAAMAFSFMPTGTSVKPGVYNGHAVLFPYDEETGQPEGEPVVLTPQLLSDIATQFGNPANWEKVVQDRRTADRGDTLLGIQQQNADAATMNAETNADYYGRKDTGSTLKPADVDRISQQAEVSTYQVMQEVGMDPDDTASARIIQSAIERAYQMSGGQKRPGYFADLIKQLLLKDPDGMNKLRAELAG